MSYTLAAGGTAPSAAIERSTASSGTVELSLPLAFLPMELPERECGAPALRRTSIAAGPLRVSRTTRIQHRALGADRHEAVLLNGLAQFLQRRSMPDVGDAGRVDSTDGQLGPKFAGNGLAARKNIEAAVDRQTASPAAGRLVAPGQESFQARVVDFRVVAHLRAPIGGVDPGQIAAKVADQRGVEPERE